QDGAVAGREDFNFRMPRTAEGGNEGHESAWREIRCKCLVNVFESIRKIFGDAETASRVCVAQCCEQCGPNTVAGDIGEADHQFSIGQSLPIKKVAASIIGWLIPAGDVESINLRLLLGEK